MSGTKGVLRQMFGTIEKGWSFLWMQSRWLDTLARWKNHYCFSSFGSLAPTTDQNFMQPNNILAVDNKSTIFEPLAQK